MKVTVLDDYQHAFDSTDAIKRLREKAEVQILTDKLPSDAAVAQALRGSQAIIPVRERTKFTASLFEQLPDLEYISQTGNHAYHVDMEAATRRGVVVSLAPGGNSTTELTFGLMLAVMRRIPQSDAAMRRGEWPLVLGYVLKGKDSWNFGPRQNRDRGRCRCARFRYECDCLGPDADSRACRQIGRDFHASRRGPQDR